MELNLNQITVPVRDIERSIAFYEKLGLTLIVKSLPDYARFVCPAGNTTFSLQRTETHESDRYTWIYFESTRLDEDVRTLMDRGITFDELPADQPWLWREAKLRDPDNNRLIIYFAGENRLNPPWRI
jgi:catechol 2,3-dioxygenase-like lactoylglutathione lyase family enzyme